MDTPNITGHGDHYGFYTVWVEAYRTTDRHTGQAVEVDHFYQNGGLITAMGCRVKKDGTCYAVPSVVTVTTPQNVADTLRAAREEG